MITYMETKNMSEIDQLRVLWTDLVARRFELKSQFDSQAAYSELGKTLEWQQEIDLRWNKLIDAENAINQYLDIHSL